jgi:hypothetical protein
MSASGYKQTISTAFNEVRYTPNNGRSGISASVGGVSALHSPNAAFHSARMSKKRFQLFPVGPTALQPSFHRLAGFGWQAIAETANRAKECHPKSGRKIQQLSRTMFAFRSFA